MIVELEGEKHEFPDDATEDEIRAALGSLKPKPPKEDVTAGMALRGIPVLGAYVPQAEAAIRSAAQPLTGVGQAGETFSERYAKNLAESERQYRMAEEESPITSEALKIGGAVAGLAPIGATALGARALGATGPMAARIPLGAASGAGLSAADAYVRGQDPQTAAIVGGGLGAAAPVVGAAIGRGVEAVRGRNPAVLAERMGRAATRADELTPAGVAARGAELGPEGTVAEFGPNLEGLAQAVATQPGKGKTQLFETMTQRGDTARQRIEGSISAALGPRQDLAAVTRSDIAARGAAADPLYDAWRRMTVQPTPELRDLIPRLERDGLLAEAQRLMSLEGRNPNVDFHLTGQDRTAWPTAEAYDYLKQAIDGRIGAALSPLNPNRNIARIYQGVKERLDNAIASSSPQAAQIWQQARQTWANPTAVMNAREVGQDIMNIRRDELRQTLQAMSAPERAAVMEGIRDTLAEMMDRSMRGDQNTRNVLLAPALQEKIMMVAPNRAQAAELFQQMRREVQFGETRSRLLHGSQTAARQAMGEVTKPQPGSTIGSYLRGFEFSRPASWFGASQAPAAVQNLAEGRNAARYERARDILADMLRQQGPQAQQSLLRLMQPPPPTAQNASRFGTVGTQMIAPYFF